jgi:hypothetical protein
MRTKFRAFEFAIMMAGAFMTIAIVRPAVAHHAFAAFFDPNQPMDVSGVVSSVEWANPHVWIYVDVETDGGDTESWGFEMGSVNQLVRLGWSRDALRAGDRVTISGVRARDRSLIAAVRTVMLASGEQLFGGQSESR